jgi:hypothetical protein
MAVGPAHDQEGFPPAKRARTAPGSGEKGAAVPGALTHPAGVDAHPHASRFPTARAHAQAHMERIPRRQAQRR